MNDTYPFFAAFGAGSTPAPRVQEYDSTEPYPEDELTDGIAHVEVGDYGDYPREYFIQVSGVDKTKVCEMWVRVRNVLQEVNWWQHGSE